VLLHSQTGTAFGATSSEYLAAIFRGHAGTETVSAFALKYAWLKGSFHDGESATIVFGREMTQQVKKARDSIDFRPPVQISIVVVIIWPVLLVVGLGF